MATISGKDVVDLTYNSQDLKAYVMSIDGLEEEEIITQYRAPGSAYKTTVLTGQYDHSDVTVKFIYDGSATGPAVKCAKGTSSTFTITLATGMSITGTAKVRKRTTGVPEDGSDTFDVVFVFDGAVTWDLAA